MALSVKFLAICLFLSLNILNTLAVETVEGLQIVDDAWKAETEALSDASIGLLRELSERTKPEDAKDDKLAEIIDFDVPAESDIETVKRSGYFGTPSKAISSGKAKAMKKNKGHVAYPTIIDPSLIAEIDDALSGDGDSLLRKRQADENQASTQNGQQGQQGRGPGGRRRKQGQATGDQNSSPKLGQGQGQGMGQGLGAQRRRRPQGTTQGQGQGARLGSSQQGQNLVDKSKTTSESADSSTGNRQGANPGIAGKFQGRGQRVNGLKQPKFNNAPMGGQFANKGPALGKQRQQQGQQGQQRGPGQNQRTNLKKQLGQQKGGPIGLGMNTKNQNGQKQQLTQSGRRTPGVSPARSQLQSIFSGQNGKKKRDVSSIDKLESYKSAAPEKLKLLSYAWTTPMFQQAFQPSAMMPQANNDQYALQRQAVIQDQLRQQPWNTPTQPMVQQPWDVPQPFNMPPQQTWNSMSQQPWEVQQQPMVQQPQIFSQQPWEMQSQPTVQQPWNVQPQMLPQQPWDMQPQPTVQQPPLMTFQQPWETQPQPTAQQPWEVQQQPWGMQTQPIARQPLNVPPQSVAQQPWDVQPQAPIAPPGFTVSNVEQVLDDHPVLPIKPQPTFGTVQPGNQVTTEGFKQLIQAQAPIQAPFEPNWQQPMPVPAPAPVPIEPNWQQPMQAPVPAPAPAPFEPNWQQSMDFSVPVPAPAPAPVEPNWQYAVQAPAQPNRQISQMNPCTGGGQLFPAEPSMGPSYYIHCDNGVPNLRQCGPGTVWNQAILTCDWETSQQPMRQTLVQEPTVSYQQLRIPYEGCASGLGEGILLGNQIGEVYCRCPSGTYGIDCQENFANPCVEGGNQLHPADSRLGANYFIHCENSLPHLRKCAEGTVWNQAITVCDWAYYPSNDQYSQSASYAAAPAY